MDSIAVQAAASAAALTRSSALQPVSAISETRDAVAVIILITAEHRRETLKKTESDGETIGNRGKVYLRQGLNFVGFKSGE